MRKITFMMLMAVGLLISASMSAMPERPVPPEPKAPEGVEMVKPNARQILEAPASAPTKAPNKAAATPVAKIGEQTFTTLKAALDAVDEGQTITLLAGVEEEKRLEINKANVTLDLNQNRIHYTGGDNVSYDDSPWAIASNAEGVTIKDGDVYYDYPFYYFNVSPWYSYNTRAISANGGTLTLENVVASGAYGYGGTYAVWIEGGATVTIEDGCYIYGNTASSGEDVYVNPKSTGTYILHGGEYTKNRYIVPDGYMWFDNGDGTYTVMEKKVAKIGTTTYKTIAEAINAAKANDEIVLLDNIDGDVVVDGTNLTINTDAYAINGELSVSNATVKVKGGDITSFNEGTDGDIDIYSGTYTIAKTTLDSYVAAGYTARDNGDGTCTVGKFVAQIGSDFYFGLQDAFDHVPESGVEPTTITITAPITEELNITLSDKRNVKLDLAGYTIMFTNRNMITIEAGSKLVFANTQSSSIYSTGGDAIFDCYGTLELGNMSITSKGDAIFWNEKGGNVTIYDGTYTSEGSTYGIMYNEGTLHIVDGTFKGGDSAYGLYVAGGTVTIDDINLYAGWYALYVKGGTITMTDGDVFSDFYGIYSNSKSTITVEGGTITGDEYYAIQLHGSETLNINGGEFISKQVILSSYGATTNVKGGKFKKPSGAIFSKNSGKIYVSGGFFNTTDIGDCEIKTGYALVKTTVEGEEGDWYEVGKIEAQVGELGYLHIEDAIAAAVAAGEQYVIVVADLEDVEVNQSITLCLGKHTINSLTATNGATVIVEGRPEATISSVNGNVLLKGGSYTFNPEISNNVAEDYDVKTIEGEPTKYQVGVYAAKLSTDGKTYMTLKEAIIAAGTADSAVITMVKDLMVYESGTTIAVDQNITIDLNGHLISTDDRNALDVFVQGSSLLNNRGILTITDGSEAGNGKITYYCAQPDLSGYSASDVTINNYNKMYVKGGTIENRGIGASSYAIDMWSGTRQLIITKGVVISPNSTAIRVVGWADEHGEIKIDGGKDNEVTVGPIWMQDMKGASTIDVTIDIKHAIIEKIRLGYSGTGKRDKLIVKLDHVKNENGFFRLDFDPDELNYQADSCTIQSYYLAYPFPHLTSGIFQFKNDIQLYYVNYTQALKTQYPEEEGWKIVRDSNDPSYAEVYISAEKLLHEFYQNIMPGYGLVCIDEVNKWYEIRPLEKGNDYDKNHIGEPDDPTANTGKIDPAGGEENDNLANYWHRKPTWASEEVPQSGDPVIIDHNVIVEPGTTANAASVVIDPNQKLIVEKGATLHIEDAGALFKENEDGETGQLIIKPTGIVTVGDNGVISDKEDNIIVQAEGQDVGVFLVDPDVHINTQPLGTVEMIATVGKNEFGENVWHRFAMPVVKLDEPWGKEPGLSTYLYEWSYTDKKWVLTPGGSTSMKPFMGYTISVDESAQKVKYTFTGNLLGNEASEINFRELGYGYFGNSYTGHMLTKVLLTDVMELGDDVEGTVWLWNPATQSYKGSSKQDLIAGKDLDPFEEEIAPMQTFILRLNSGQGTDINIDYDAAIWSNPRYELVSTPSAAPAYGNNDEAYIRFNVASASGQADIVRMTENDEYSDEHENGVDAPKFMNENRLNMYTSVAGVDYTSLYTDNLEGKTLTLQSVEDVNYTLTIGYVEGNDYALVDLFTGDIISLVEGTTYDFVAQPNATAERFQVIRAHKAPTAMDQVKNSKAVKGVYTPMGQYVGEAAQWNNMPSGVYMINGVKVVK